MPAGMTAARAKQARILYEEGHGRNAIAKQLGVGVATVSRWAERENLQFDRSQTELAVRAHVIDLRADAVLGAQEAMVVARDLLHRVHRGNYEVHAFGGEDGELRTGILDDAPAEAVRTAVMTMGVAIDKAMKIREATNEGVVQTRSMIDAVVTQIGMRLDD